MVRTTKEERRLPKIVFEEIISQCYPEKEDWNLKITQLTSRSKAGHLKIENWKNKLTLGINFEQWRDRGSASRLSLLLHESAHIVEFNHKPTFFQEMANNYLQVEHNRTIEEALDFADWYSVAEAVVLNPNHATIDKRTLNTIEARLIVKDIIEWDVDIWRNVKINDTPSTSAQRVNLEDVSLDRTYSEEGLSHFLDEWTYGYKGWTAPSTPVVKSVRGEIQPAGEGYEELRSSEMIIQILMLTETDEFRMTFGRDLTPQVSTRAEID